MWVENPRKEICECLKENNEFAQGVSEGFRKEMLFELYLKG